MEFSLAPWQAVSIALSIAATVIAGTAWLVGHQGRLKSHEAICAERYANIEREFSYGAKEMTDIKGSVRDVNAKLDRLLLQRRHDDPNNG